MCGSFYQHIASSLAVERELKTGWLRHTWNLAWRSPFVSVPLHFVSVSSQSRVSPEGAAKINPVFLQRITNMTTCLFCSTGGMPTLNSGCTVSHGHSALERVEVCRFGRPDATPVTDAQGKALVSLTS